MNLNLHVACDWCASRRDKLVEVDADYRIYREAVPYKLETLWSGMSTDSCGITM